jgi:hypothetical protein
MSAQPVLLVDDDEPILDFLNYCSYRAQRYESPDVSPERWGTLPHFANWREFEARFQVERAEYLADTLKHLDSWIVDRGANA